MAARHESFGRVGRNRHRSELEPFVQLILIRVRRGALLVLVTMNWQVLGLFPSLGGAEVVSEVVGDGLPALQTVGHRSDQRAVAVEWHNPPEATDLVAGRIIPSNCRTANSGD